MFQYKKADTTNDKRGESAVAIRGQGKPLAGIKGSEEAFGGDKGVTTESKHSETGWAD